jgi:hypothetical protein
MTTHRLLAFIIDALRTCYLQPMIHLAPGDASASRSTSSR